MGQKNFCIPKSQAELTKQFQDIAPNELELGPINNERYMAAYGQVALQLTNSDIETGMTVLGFNETHLDIIKNKSPFGYVAALRKYRRGHERRFARALDVARASSEGGVLEKEAALRAHTIHLGDDDGAVSEVAHELFPSNNYFLHATNTDAIIAILKEGRLRATATFAEDKREEVSTGGSFGVSGNYNAVSNLLGTPNHLAGFIADPLTVLQNQGGYFAPLSKTCWNELQYLPSNNDPMHVMRLRDAETHSEIVAGLCMNFVTHGATLQGNQNMIATMPPEGIFMLGYEFSRTMRLIAEQPNLLHRAYRTTRTGEFRFTEMLGNDNEAIGPFEVVVGAAKEGVFGEDIAAQLKQHGADVLDNALLQTLDPVVMRLMHESKALYDSIAQEISSNAAIEVENMLLYCPSKDYEKWVRAVACMPHQPKGIVTYQSNGKIRTPAAFSFALPDEGCEELTRQLSVLSSEKSIPWEDVFEDPPVQSIQRHFLIRPREANLAGVLTLNDEKELVVKSLDELDEDDD